jgi:hypothetical protein
MRSERNAGYWIEKLNLAEHPEGGCFAPAFRASEQISREGLPDGFTGNRAIVSSIYYLLKKGQFSAFHRLKSIEILPSTDEWCSRDSTTVSLARAQIKGNNTSLESHWVHHGAAFSCSSIRSWSPYIRATKMLKYSCKFLVSKKFCRTNSFAIRPISRALSG